MAKRKTIKPVKAWMHVRNGRLLTGPFGNVYFDKVRANFERHKDTVVRVTISVDDPKATRISAAQRRVVEAVHALIYSKNDRAYSRNLTKLREEYAALERAKRDRK
jgi:hypothetical protein